MKKLIVIGLLVSNVAHADTTSYVQYFGSMLIGGAITTTLKNIETSRQEKALENRQVTVLPVNASQPLFKKCELRSVVINEQIITNNYCY